MLMTFEDTSKLILSGKQLHIAGTEGLIKKLPSGKWIGGSTEYFITKEGGKISGELLFVTELPYEGSVKTYTAENIDRVAIDAFDNGFSIVIMPFGSAVFSEYAKNAPNFKDMFMKNIVGWISGNNINSHDQTPIAVDGTEAAAYCDRAVVFHLKVPNENQVQVEIVNIFSPSESSPVITFKEDGFSVKNCFVDGKEMLFADYISQNGIDTKLPIIGNYAGHGINVSFKSSKPSENGAINLYAPVFSGIEYRFAKSISDYDKKFNDEISKHKGANAVFSCNCILNFLYGNLEGKKIDSFVGPITFGEIAFQLLDQTLVYVTVD